MPDRVVQEIRKDVPQHHVGKDLEPPGLVGQFHPLGKMKVVDHVGEVLPFRVPGAEVFEESGELNLLLDSPRGLLQPFQHGQLDRIGDLVLRQGEVPEHHHHVVADVVPGDTCQEAELPVRRPERVLSDTPLGDVLDHRDQERHPSLVVQDREDRDQPPDDPSVPCQVPLFELEEWNLPREHPPGLFQPDLDVVRVGDR